MSKEANSTFRALKLALEALELVNLEFVCANGSHHAKEDRHEWDEDCPITDRWRKAITALRKALANEALDKMAENARELGLDYEPAQQEPVNPEPFGYFQYDIRLDAWVQNRVNNKGVAFYTKEKP